MKLFFIILLISAVSGCLKSSPLVEQPSPDLTSVSSSTPRTTPSAKVKIIPFPSEFRSDEKRDLKTIDTIVIHSVHNPVTTDRFAIANIKKVFDDNQVSSHYVITRDGEVYQLVPEDFLAWHAGESKMPKPDNREKVNYFSIGIELVGDMTSEFTDAQYASLVTLTTDIKTRLSIAQIVGHSDIAPGRKTDPWNFDWKRFEESLSILSQ